VSENSSAPSSDGAAAPSPLSVGAPAEHREGERRVAITPSVIGQYQKLGASVVVESGAGAAAGFADEEYADKGATVGSREDALGADIVACVRVLGGDPASPDAAQLRPGQAVVGMAAPLAAPEVSAAVAARGAALFSLELLPRTTRAQSMDVLSSQANIAGYRCALLAAEALPKLFPLMTTAAGTIPPARVFVVGAGVAGLSAIATARRLGALVEAYDVREAAKEEVQSLGARFVELPLETGQEGSGSGAYASAMTDEALARQRELMLKTVAASDVVITTAQVQGAKAPVLITAEMVEAMSPGSVIVDLAAEQGGNCAATLPGRTVDVGGVRVIGPVDVTSSLPVHASLMYAKNVCNFAALLVADGALALDTDDDLVVGSAVARGGRIVNERVSGALGAEEVAR
jgi:proton-translocating NAD(P)+ transhydrogenase subunit alpha